MTQNGQGPEQTGAQQWGGAWGPAGGQQPQGGQPLPPEAPAGDLQATQYLAPVPGHQPGQQPGYGYPPPAADLQATQHIAPVPGGMPPVGPPAGPRPGYGYPPPAAADAEATRHLPQVPPQPGPGAGGSDTQFLGTGRLPQQAPPGASDATQYIAPVPGGPGGMPGGIPGGGPGGAPGDRQPPAEFDNLFRQDAPPQRAQTPPPYQRPGYQQPAPQPGYPHQAPQPPQPHQAAHPPHQAQPPQPYGHQGGGAGYQDAYQDAYYDGEPEPPRRKAPVALIAAVVVGCAVVGLGAGALLSGGEDEKTPRTPQNAAASSQAPSASAEPSEKPADPAEPQAKELDKLLETSNDSRDAVISSVELIKQCKNLDKAAADLRGAAQQRRDLVTKLQSLAVDKLPDHQALTAALTRAWQASAAADDHYAGWADQMKGKKACKDGRARSTDRLAAANRKSGEATAAKKEAAGLWNPTAAKYGLERRSPTQL